MCGVCTCVSRPQCALGSVHTTLESKNEANYAVSIAAGNVAREAQQGATPFAWWNEARSRALLLRVSGEKCLV